MHVRVCAYMQCLRCLRRWSRVRQAKPPSQRKASTQRATWHHPPRPSLTSVGCTLTHTHTHTHLHTLPSLSVCKSAQVHQHLCRHCTELIHGVPFLCAGGTPHANTPAAQPAPSPAAAAVAAAPTELYDAVPLVEGLDVYEVPEGYEVVGYEGEQGVGVDVRGLMSAEQWQMLIQARQQMSLLRKMAMQF